VAIIAQAVKRGLLQQNLHQNRGVEYRKHYRFARITNPKSYRQADEAVCKAISEVLHHCGASLVGLTAMVDYGVFPCRYAFYMEIEYPDQDVAGRSEMMLENALRHTSPRYHPIRQNDGLEQPALRVVQPGTFAKLKNVLIARGASAYQIKIPWIIRDQELASLLAANTFYAASDALLASY
jgi:hypothetical protein